MNLGDRLVVDGKQKKLTALNGFGYLRAPALAITLPGTGPLSVSSSEAPGAWLVKQFGLCHWQHQRLAPQLLTGAVALAVLDGALSIHPVLAIGGSVQWGAQQVLRMIGSILGPFVAVAYEADEMRVSEAVNWDSLAALIDPSRGGSSARSWRSPRAPSWVGETASVRTRPYEGMRFCLAGTASRMSLRDDPNFLELALSGRPDPELGVVESDCKERRVLLVRRMIDQFSRLTGVIFPKWCELLEVQEGDTALARTMAMLLAAAWVLRGDAAPTESDFVALQPDCDQLMGLEHEWRRPPWRQVLDCVRAAPVILSSYERTTLLDKIGIAVGKVVIGEMPIFEADRWTEERAKAHARSDPAARAAQHLIGQYGLKVLDDLPEKLRTDSDPGGYRCLAVAMSAPLRDQQLEHMSGWQRLLEQGMDIRTLLEAPKARALRSTEHFPTLGSLHCLVLPLDLMIGGSVGDDPGGTEDAWRQMGDEA